MECHNTYSKFNVQASGGDRYGGNLFEFEINDERLQGPTVYSWTNNLSTTHEIRERVIIWITENDTRCSINRLIR